MTSTRQRAWVELGEAVSQVLRTHGSSSRRDAAALKEAAKALGLTHANALRAHSAFMRGTQIDAPPPSRSGARDVGGRSASRKETRDSPLIEGG